VTGAKVLTIADLSLLVLPLLVGLAGLVVRPHERVPLGSTLAAYALLAFFVGAAADFFEFPSWGIAFEFGRAGGAGLLISAVSVIPSLTGIFVWNRTARSRPPVKLDSELGKVFD
jgi:hypothetical protein